MSKHTPGPWSNPKNSLSIRAGNYTIAQVVAFWRSTDSQISDDNARLIAAAPELVRMLDRACIELARAGHHDGVSGILTEARALLSRIGA